MEQEMEYRDFQMDHSDDMSDVTLSTLGSSSQYDKNTRDGSRKWGLLWKTKNPLQTAKKLKKSMKKKIRREPRDSPEMDDVTTVEENSSKSWGVHWPKRNSNKSYFEGVLDEDETPDDEVPGRHPIESTEDVSRLLAELNQKFRNQEEVDEYHLCRLELQQKLQEEQALSAEEFYELGLLERHASGEELNEEANDLDDFVEKRMLYKRLQIDLEYIRGKQQHGAAIDEDLLFVLELFERRRLEKHLDTTEKLALDLLQRDRLGDTLDNSEMDELIDIMDLLRNRKGYTNTYRPNEKHKECNSSLMVEDDEGDIEEIDGSPTMDPWSKGDWNEALEEEARNDVEKTTTTTAGTGDTTPNSRGGGSWLLYWRSTQQSTQQRDAERTRERIQKELLDKALLKAKVLMEIDNLKMDLKKANTSVLELGGNRDETTRVILNEGGLPPDEIVPEEPGVSQENFQKVRSECEGLKESNQEKEGKIATLEAQVRELRAKTVTSARRGSKWGTQAEDSSSAKEDSETLSKLAAECDGLKEQLKQVNERNEESEASRESMKARLAELQQELEQCSQDLQAARDDLGIREKEMQNAAFEFSALNVRYKAASSKIERLEEEYPETTKERVAELLEEAGKSGGVETLVDCYELAVATVETLEVQLESAEQENAAAIQKKAEFNLAVEMCNELETNAERLRSKLEAAETVAANAKEEKQRVEESIAQVKMQMHDLEQKMESAEQENTATANQRQAEYNDAMAMCKKLAEDSIALESQLEAAKLQVTNVKEENERVLSELEGARLRIKELEAKLESVTEETAVANQKQADYYIAVGKCEELEKDIQGLQSLLKSAEQQVIEANQEKDRACDAVIAESRLKIENLQTRLTTQEQENAAAVEQRQAEYNLVLAMSQKLETTVEELESKLEASGSEVATVKEERERVLEEIKETKSQLEDLEAKLASAEQETAAAYQRQADYDKSLELCKKLEQDSADLQSKLQAAENQVTKSHEEKKQAWKDIAKARLRIADQDTKLGALSQQVQQLEGENRKLLEENVELKELCEEMIAGIGDDGVDC